MRNQYDVIVIGVGSMGAPTCYYLAERGMKVLGVEQFDIPNQKSSHGGQSRLIRKAYFENPDYVPLLELAYKNWKVFEERTNSQFYYPTGLLYSGMANEELLSGLVQSSSLYHVPLEEFDASKQESHVPQFHLPNQYTTILEPDAGFVTPEKAILAFKEEAENLGARIQTNEAVMEWSSDSNGVKVKTTKGTYSAGKLVITAGPWTNRIVDELPTNLKITQQLLTWIRPKNPEAFQLGNFPCWGIQEEGDPGLYYGFPIMQEPGPFGETGLKVAHHILGDEIDPSNKDNFDEKEEVKKLMSMLDRYLPEAVGELLHVKSCLYSNTPDSEFIIDILPQHNDRVSIACGFSGHGFKFAPAIGEIMADFATDGKTKHPVEFLHSSRF